jgi:hypothetical protein
VGKHDNHGGNVQVITVPDGWPIWTSDVRPGREHDTTAVRAHTEILPTLGDAADDLRALGDLGYEGESETITVAFRNPKAAAHPDPAATEQSPQQDPRHRRAATHC